MANKLDRQQNEFLNFDADENGERARFVMDSKAGRLLDKLVNGGGFFTQASLGLVDGITTRILTGLNDNINTAGMEDITIQGGDYTFLAAAETLDISSSDPSDTSGGTGARTVFIEGLDDNFDVINETITMNGVMSVTTVNSYRRVNIMKVLTAGSSNFNEGLIDLVDSSANILARVGISSDGEGHNNYLSTVQTVPRGKTVVFFEINISLYRASGSAGTKEGIVFFVSKNESSNVFETISTLGARTDGSSNSYRAFVVPRAVAEKTDFKVRADAFNNNTAISVISNIAFIDNATFGL